MTLSHKIKIELKGSGVTLYYWKKIFFIWGEWIPYHSKGFGSIYDAYVDYENICKSINPFYKPIMK